MMLRPGTARPDDGAVYRQALRLARDQTGVPLTFGGQLSGDHVVLEEFLGAQTDHLAGLRVAHGRGIGGYAVAELRPVALDDYVAAADITHDYDSQVRGEGIRAIVAARAGGARVVSADLPSGLPSDTPTPFDPCVQADLTVALGAPKVAQVIEPGATRCGQLHVVDLGLVGEVPRDLELLEEQAVRARLSPRAADTHKGTYGHVLVVAGAPGKTGAAAMSGLGALRGGAGLVTVATREAALPWVQLQAPELMGVPLPGTGPLALGDLDALAAAAKGKDALVVGPGIPRGPQTAVVIGELLAQGEAPVVLDADALNAIAQRLEVLGRARGEVLLTPHPGEMATLLGTTTAQVQKDRLGAARTLRLDGRIGNFTPGKEADFVLLDGAHAPVLKQRLANAKSWAERLFAFAMLGDDRAVARTWVAGETAYRRS